MCSKKWHLKRNISCDVHLLNELLETVLPWDDAIVVSAGKLRKLWYSLTELSSSLCERRLERTVLRPSLLPVKTTQFTQIFPSVMTSHSKIARFNWECIGRLRRTERDTITNLHKSSCKVPRCSCQIVIKLKLCQQIFGISSNKVHENPSSTRQVALFWRTDGQTDINYEA